MFKELYFFYIVWISQEIAVLDDENFEYIVGANYGTSNWLILVSAPGSDKIQEAWSHVHERIIGDETKISKVKLGVAEYSKDSKLVDRLAITEAPVMMYIQGSYAYTLPLMTSSKKILKWLESQDLGTLPKYQIPKIPGYWAQIFKSVNEVIVAYPFWSIGIIILLALAFSSLTERCKSSKGEEEEASGKDKES